MPPHVKTSLAPGSRVVTDYFEKAGLDKYLEKVGFYTVGYGCTTCIGNSGPLPEPISAGREEERSGRRRRALRQPQLRRPHQSGREGELPGQPAAGRRLRARRHDRHRLRKRAARRRHRTARRCTCATSGRRTPKCKRSSTAACCPRCSQSSTATSGTRTPSGTRSRRAKASSTNGTPTSTYIQEPPFLVDLPPEPGPIQPIRGARCLGRARRLGDDRPHLAGRLDRQGQPRRQVPHRRSASSRATSTATAPAAATTA